MYLNINIGILGHVDSGKTTLARALSEIVSTAAFDKHPQSMERGITLDLGFSALITDLPEHFYHSNFNCNYEKLQLTFVDCPGHSSLIRTIIGGAQIIDTVLLVIDAQKGIQTQTGECLVISELTCRKLMIVINKIDLFNEQQRQEKIDKLISKLRKTFNSTIYGSNVPIVCLSALKKEGITEFVDKLKEFLEFPKRDVSQQFLFSVDHCFTIKGKGTICTGTVLQGQVNVNDTIEVPLYKLQRKVKSMQMFHRPIQTGKQGDRIGICLANFDSSSMERGLLCGVDYVKKIYAAIINIKKIKYFKYSIKSKTKYHISVGHETVMGRITIFRYICKDNDVNSLKNFDLLKDYEYVDEFIDNESTNNTSYFALIEFDIPILSIENALVIGSKLDINSNTVSNTCRIAFWGNIEWLTCLESYVTETLCNIKIYKEKSKQGVIQRVVNENEIIVQNLFKKESKRELFIGKCIQLSTGEDGFIESTFGQAMKVKVRLPNGMKSSTLEKITEKSKLNTVYVILKFKKYIFNKNTKDMIFQ